MGVIINSQEKIDSVCLNNAGDLVVHNVVLYNIRCWKSAPFSEDPKMQKNKSIYERYGEP